MASGIEQIVRENDDLGLSIADNAKRISRKFDLNENTCYGYLMAERKGFGSHNEYKRALAIRRGCFLTEYMILQRTSKQKRFERSLENNYELDSLVGAEDLDVERRESINLLYNFLKELPERLRKILIERYFLDNSLRHVAVKYEITYERVRQLEQRALELLRKKFRKVGLSAA